MESSEFDRAAPGRQHGSTRIHNQRRELAATQAGAGVRDGWERIELGISGASVPANRFGDLPQLACFIEQSGANGSQHFICNQLHPPDKNVPVLLISL